MCIRDSTSASFEHLIQQVKEEFQASLAEERKRSQQLLLEEKERKEKEKQLLRASLEKELREEKERRENERQLLQASLEREMREKERGEKERQLLQASLEKEVREEKERGEKERQLLQASQEKEVNRLLSVNTELRVKTTEYKVLKSINLRLEEQVAMKDTKIKRHNKEIEVKTTLLKQKEDTISGFSKQLTTTREYLAAKKQVSNV